MATTTTKKKPTAKKTATTREKKPSWGGRREGAGRKKGFKLVENPKNTMLPFRVSEATARRIKQLRELTKQDDMPFVDTFEKWVEEYAQSYGIE